MNRREARRLALLIVWEETLRGLDVSDEWISHPETNDPFTRADCIKVKDEGAKIVASLEAQANRLGPS